LKLEEKSIADCITEPLEPCDPNGVKIKNLCEQMVVIFIYLITNRTIGSFKKR